MAPSRLVDAGLSVLRLLPCQLGQVGPLTWRLTLCPGQGVGRGWCEVVLAAAYRKIVSQISPEARMAGG